MNDKISANAVVSEDIQEKPPCVVDAIVEKKLEEIATVLYPSGVTKSRLYEEMIGLVERCLIKTALKKNNNVKSAAAAYLGINRNTFQNKMVKLGLNGQKG